MTDDRSNAHQAQAHRLPAFLLSAEHPCSYLPENNARIMFLDPEISLDSAGYQSLLERGFRRSGEFLYRPRCTSCQACVSIRIPVAAFRPRRSQRRCRILNSQVVTFSTPPQFNAEHYELYSRYTHHRHPDGGMKDSGPAEYLSFLASPWSETRLIEFRIEGRLMAVAVTDLLPNGLSAVYTFFEPELERSSPGVLVILWQIQEARRLGLDRLYLGYWIAECRKMRYKEEFRPLEAWSGHDWVRFVRGREIQFP